MSTNTMDGFRLSLQQERTWSQQAQGTKPFWAESEILITGHLDPDRLKEVIRSAVGRHEILRTVFHQQPGVKIPFQVIGESSAFSWQFTDLRNLNEMAQRAEVNALVRKGEAGSNPGQGPALQVVLAQVTPETHIMVLSLPALCADLRTMQNLAEEIGRAYAGELDANNEIMQYADIAEWQRDLLTNEETQSGREFWRDYHRKLDPSSWESLLAAFEHGSTGDFAPDVVVKEIDFPRSIDGSCADFLFACWQLFLARMTGKSTITSAREFEGRTYDELSGALGLFSRYIPSQSTIPDTSSFRAFLQQVERDCAEFQNWQDSFSWNADSPRGSDQSLTLPVAFDYFALPSDQKYGSLTFSSVREEACCERFQLKLSIRRKEDRLGLEFHFDSARLDRNTVEYWSTCFLTLLEAAALAEDTPTLRLPLLSQPERHRLLVDWNQTAAEYPSQRCIFELFEAQAALTPERPAVRSQDQQLTYQELNEHANQLAHYLRNLGVCPDSLVGLCVDRSVGLVVALLGILKAGGAYVPLNADNPKPRLAQQLSRAVVLITEQKLLAQMPETACKTFCIDDPKKPWADRPISAPELRGTPENLAYLLYTSGSTGVPKGVAVRHRNLVNYSEFIAKRLNVVQHPEGLQFATVSTIAADLGNTCIYPSLISGGCLHLISYEVATDAQKFAQYVGQHPVDVLKIVPSHLQALLHAPEAKRVLPRRYLITGGEALTPRLVEMIVDLKSSCEIMNHYGPTETTVGSLTLKLSEFDWRQSTALSIPIGRPIANTHVYILDALQQPVPLGVTGELYIAGDGVTAGYLNDPDRTAEKFISNPFVKDPMARMYRTGDLVRYLADGNIEFLGRADDQVKIRGFRIELGEIEAVLAAHADVKQTVVLARADETGEKQLLAYVVLSIEGASSSEDLRRYLKEQLPEYMVPAAIILLPRMPLTANGKIDRQSLPEPEKAAARQYVAPRTSTEEVVCNIWAEVLRRDRVSTEDNFFDLGGHSLLATQVISRIRRALSVDLPLRTLFETPTVAAIAEQIDRHRRDPLLAEVPPITKAPRDQDLPLSFAQQRLWVLDQMQPNNPLYNIPRRLRMRGNLNVDALTTALNKIVERHESQRTTFAVHDGTPVQVIAPSLVIDVALRDLCNLHEDDRITEARRIAGEEALIPFDLATGPLLRATLLKLAVEDHILLLTMHHIVSDAWSAGVFFQEFGELYESFCNGRAPSLLELPIQYADYAAWQRTSFSGEVLNHQLTYWREQLKGAPPVLQLPSDRPRAKEQTFQGAHETISISGQTARALRKLGQQEGMTLFMTLLAGFQTLLSRYSGQEQLVIGTDLANRTTTETERLIGFFINLLALRGDLSGNPTFRELLGRVREVALGAYAHQAMPFDKLVEELQPERSLSHNPLVQVLFVMQNLPRQKRELPGLTLEPFELPSTRSKFDLAVFVVDGGDDLTCYWLYSTDLFDRTTIERMARHFETLLSNAAALPDTRLSALEMLSEEERLEQDAGKQQKKQSQLKKLLTAQPKAIQLPDE